MYHQGTVQGSAVRAASLLALAGAGLFGLAATAGAAGTTASAAGTTVGTAGMTGAIPVGYSCSLAAYGQGLAPLNIPAALSAESTGLTVTVKLVTQPVQVPAATASALPQLSYLDIAGAASANGMSGTAVNLSGQSGYLGTTAGSMTQLPAMTATFSVDGVQEVAKATFPSGMIYGNTRYPGLRLITCGGPFDTATRQYLDNIVVYTHLVG